MSRKKSIAHTIPSGNCAVCQNKLPFLDTGRPRITCSGRCRQILYRHKRALRRMQLDFFQKHPSAAGPRGIAMKEYIS